MKLSLTLKLIVICCMIKQICQTKKEIIGNKIILINEGLLTKDGLPTLARPLLNTQLEWTNQMAHEIISNRARRNNRILTCQNNRKALSTILLLIIITSGDVELNPGPTQKSIYPCGICERRVNWSARAIACDDCNIWFHQSCLSMSDGTYNNHVQNESIIWICNHCGTPNYGGSFTFHSYEQSTSVSNRFSALYEDESSLRSPEANFKPRYTSSPAVKSNSCSNDLTTESSNDDISNPFPIKSCNNLRILTTNVQSIRGKTAEFKSALEYCKPDICCITETWLFGKKPGKDYDQDYRIRDSELGLNNYRIFRNDRNELGGGVAIFVRNNIIAIEEPQFVTNCELNWIKIKLAKTQKDLLVGCFYMPHRNLKDLEELNQSLEIITSGNYRHIILCGDFNSPDIYWDTLTLKQNADDKEIHQRLIQITSQHALHQVVTDSTRGQNTLDLIFTTNPSLMKTSSSLPGISDHDIVLGDFNSQPHLLKFKKRSVLVFRRANWDSLKLKCHEISNNIIQKTSNSVDIDDIWKSFKSDLQNAIHENIPSKTFVNRNTVPWMSNELKKMIRKKTKLYKKAKKNNKWSNFRKIQKECKKAFRTAERNYVSNQLQEGFDNNNTKPLWRYIKSKRQDNTGVTPLLDKGKLITEDTEIANSLLNQFKSVFTTSKPKTPPQLTKHDVDEVLTNITIKVNGVENLLRNIKAEKASGPDCIPNRVLKECAKELAPGITALFQLSLNTGTLPYDWKNANITPIFKKGDRRKAENYRPVSLTSVTSKLLEHIVCKKMLDHLEHNKILTNRNHGFRRGYSCETQLAITIDDLTRAHDKDTQIDVAILDFSKAFDTVPHDRLLLKLQAYGIEGQLHRWLENYLCKRKMKVLINGEASEEAEVLSGVPQGTVLGPLLFLCHINDLPQSVTSTVRLFADDCLLYRNIKSIQDHENMQQDLKKLEEWADTWGMKFNATKCYILSIASKSRSQHFYQLGSTILKEVQVNPYLGINISNDLNWSHHINKTCAKANSVLGFIRRNLYLCPRVAKRAAYLSLVRSILEYGAIIWDPVQIQDIQQLERIQRKAARFIEGDYKSRYPGCVTHMMQRHDLTPLQDRRKALRLTFMFKIIKGHLPSIKADQYFEPIVGNKRKIKATTYEDHITYNPIEKYANNNDQCYKIPNIQNPNGAYSQSFFPRTTSDWNKLSNKVVAAGSIENFKTLLTKN